MLQRFEATLLLEDRGRRAGMELDHVQIVRMQTTKTLLNAGNDVLPCEDVLVSFAWRRVDRTTALRGQVELRAAGAKGGADALFAYAVVDRRVDVVDACIEDCAQDPFGLGIVDDRSARGTAEFHRAVAELGDLQARAAERARGKSSCTHCLQDRPDAARASARLASRNSA